jgi:hypothetical protein
VKIIGVINGSFFNSVAAISPAMSIYTVIGVITTSETSLPAMYQCRRNAIVIPRTICVFIDGENGFPEVQLIMVI